MCIRECVFKIAQEYPGVAFRIAISCANFCGKPVCERKGQFSVILFFHDCCHFAFQQCRRGQSGENKSKSSKVVLQHSWKVLLSLESGSNVGFILGEEAVTTGFARFKCPRSVFLCAYRKRVCIKNLPEQTHRHTPSAQISTSTDHFPTTQTPLIRWGKTTLCDIAHTHTQKHTCAHVGTFSVLGLWLQQEEALANKDCRAGGWSNNNNNNCLPLLRLGWKFSACSSTSSRLLVYVNNFNGSKDNKDKVRRHK